MIRVASQLKQSKRILDTIRSEVPWSLSLAIGGMALQLYASVMLLKTRNPSVVKFPWVGTPKCNNENLTAIVTSAASKLNQQS